MLLWVILAGGLGAVVLALAAMRGPSASKTLKRRVELIKERHGDVIAGNAQAQIRKLMAARASRIESYASTLIPKPALLRKRLEMTGKDITLGKYAMTCIGVVLVITILLMGINFAIVGYWQPLARYSYEELDFELRSGALGASIKVGEFTQIEDRVALRIERSEDDGQRLLGIFARIADDKGQVLSISAREGRFLANRENRNTIILRLTDGTIVQDIPSQTPRVLSFSQHDLPIDLPAIERFRERGDKNREYLLPELLQLGWSENSTAEQRAGGQAAFSYRMVEVLMMLMLPLLAVSLAIPPKRSTSALGVFVSIVMVVAYHKVNQYGQSVAELGRVDPLLALWGPFFLFAALIAWMYFRVAFVPGAQAIGALESFYAKLAKRLAALLRRRDRTLSHETGAEEAFAGAA